MVETMVIQLTLPNNMVSCVRTCSQTQHQHPESYFSKSCDSSCSTLLALTFVCLPSETMNYQRAAFRPLPVNCNNYIRPKTCSALGEATAVQH